MGIIFYHIKHFSIGGEFMKVAIITTGYLPVPPCNGGAVETLCYSLMKENLINKKINITTYSIYDSKLTDYDLSQSKIVKVSILTAHKTACYAPYPRWGITPSWRQPLSTHSEATELSQRA